MRAWLYMVATAMLALTTAARAEVVAVVNGRQVTGEEFGAALVRSLGRSALDSFVDRGLIEQEARRRGVEVSRQEVAARRELEGELRWRQIIENARMGPEEFRASAERQGWDVEAVRRELQQSVSPDAMRVRLLVERMIAPTLDLSEGALRAHHKRTRGRRLLAAHVALPSRRQAEELLELLRADPDRWQEAVVELSLDRPSVPYKGRLAPVPAGCRLGRALEGLAPGELAVFGSEEGWHVLRRIGEVPATGEPFEELKGTLRAELIAVESEHAYPALLAELHRKARIVTNLSADPPERRLLGAETAAFVNAAALPVGTLAEALTREFGAAMIGPYVERLLVFQAAEREGVSVSAEEVTERMRRIGDELYARQAALRGQSREGLDGLLRSSGIDPAAFRRRLVRELVLREDVRAALLAERLAARELEVSEAEVAAAHAELGLDRAVVQELSAGEAAVAERMRERALEGVSLHVLAQTEMGGPAAWARGARTRTLTPDHPYYAMIKDLREGEVSGVFHEGGRYRIMAVLEREPAVEPPPLESVREELTAELRLRKARERIPALLLKLKAEADVELRLGEP